MSTVGGEIGWNETESYLRQNEVEWGLFEAKGGLLEVKKMKKWGLFEVNWGKMRFLWGEIRQKRGVGVGGGGGTGIIWGKMRV